MTVSLTKNLTDAAAYVTDHGQNGVPEIYVNVYRNGTRLAAWQLPGSQWMNVEVVERVSIAWLRSQGFALAGAFQAAPFQVPGTLVGCDFKVPVRR
jgi:hypothetical protein